MCHLHILTSHYKNDDTKKLNPVLFQILKNVANGNKPRIFSPLLELPLTLELNGKISKRSKFLTVSVRETN